MLRLAEGRLDEQVERLAHHAEQGELWPMAVEYLQRSGEKAFALYANADAAAYFEGALRALAHLGETREVLEQHVDLRFELRNALIALCELDRIRGCLGQLEPILERLSDKGRSARYAAFKCNHHFLAGEQRAAIAIGESGLRLAREAGDPRMQAELLYRLGQSYHLVGENAHAVEVLIESIRTTAEQRQRERFELSVIPAVVNRTWLATVLAECGNFKAGMTHAKRALEIAEETQHPLSQVLGWLAIGDLLRRKGELDGAIGALERGMKLCDRYILPIWRLRLLASLGAASGDRGRLTEAREMIDEALLSARRMHLVVDQPLLLVHSGQVSLLGGAIDDALAHAQRALELARAHEDKRNEPWARLLIARAGWMGGRANLAECRAQLDAAVRLALECGARPVAALSQAMLAAVCERQGDKARSEELSAAAERAYVELDMRPLSYESAR
jgi:tetratricopeptide (TPR) repeat protein